MADNEVKNDDVSGNVDQILKQLEGEASKAGLKKFREEASKIFAKKQEHVRAIAGCEAELEQLKAKHKAGLL